MFQSAANRRWLWAFFLGGFALLATGCSPATKVVGTWELDNNQPIPAEFFEANPLMGALLAVGKPQFQATFAGDGNFQLKFTAHQLQVEKQGSWRFVKVEGETLLLMIKEAGKTEENELRFTPVDNDHAEMTINIDLPGGKKIQPSFSFVKQKAS
jgi:hypothetical protein